MDPVLFPPFPASKDRGARGRGAGAAAASTMAMARAALLLLSSVWLSSGSADLGAGARVLQGHSDHSYKPHELVALYANKAGPFHNPRCASLTCIERLPLACFGVRPQRSCV